MKKQKQRPKNKGTDAEQQLQSDVGSLILRMQQQLTFLEKKIDALIVQSHEKPFERKDHPKPFQRFDHSRHHPEARQENDYRERVLHKAICADCNKECQVPFKPSQDRPVYCKDCFGKRKGAGPFKAKSDYRPRETEHAHVSHADKPQGGEKKRRRKTKA